MKREFDLSYKQDIIDGKVKVVTDCGEPVEIVKWNCKGNYPILAVIDDGDTSDSCFYDEEGLSSSKKERIYVLTDETEFESAYLRIVHKETPDGILPNFIEKNHLRENCKELLDIARKQIMNEQNPANNPCSDCIADDECVNCEYYKPAWSEDEEETIDYLIDYLEDELDCSYTDLDKETFTKEITLLKSLKDRVQPKQEWSEENIEILNNLIREIKLLSHMASMYWKFTDSPETILKFLKSLRPQTTWKPSDEQMKGIECAIKTLKYQLNAGDKRLNSLYNDLKKLKEK